MEEPKNPAQITPETGQEGAGTPPITSEPQSVTQGDQKDLSDALDLAKSTLDELERAQKKIRHLEKRTEGGEEADPELREEINALKEEIVALREQQQNRMTEDSNNIAKLRTREAELRASLIAKQTASNSSMGANQDKGKPEPVLPTLNRQQESLYTRIAARHGMTLEEWRKKNLK